MPIDRDVQDVEKLTPDQLAVEKVRHSAAHVMAQAVRRLWPGTKLAIGPTIENGFYYDMDIPATLTAEDLPRIEEEMREIVAADLALVQESWPKARALQYFAGEPFKLEIIRGLADDQVSTYTQGDFTDLCRGPHVARTGQVQHFKLTSVAGAYWRGLETNPMLTRLYGCAFLSAEELAEHLRRQEEARARDHRKLGKELGLFSFHPESPAMPFFHPKGAVVYNELIAYVRGIYRECGYAEVITPQIFDTSLWKTSGHHEHYLKNMFVLEVDERQFAAKPMNCPAHCVLFGTSHWSYRDLPVRFADFGRLHRYERSGVTQGLTRVRSMAQDDAHVFCRVDQIRDEILGVMAMITRVYGDMGFTSPEVHLSTKPATGALGDAAVWARAESILRDVLDGSGFAYLVEEGEGAFYGPKIDFFFKDTLGRPWQLSTIQLDFNLPERFQLSFVNAEGVAERPVIIHRAVLGTLERFMGILIEHFAGAFPPWLAPVQVMLIPITDDQRAYAGEVATKLRAAGLRVEVDARSEKMNRKIREAQLAKVPWQLVMGKREAADGTVAVRLLRGGDQGAVPLDQFIARATAVVRARALTESGAAA
jgi:threonyl-tRNA synthetase